MSLSYLHVSLACEASLLSPTIWRKNTAHINSQRNIGVDFILILFLAFDQLNLNFSQDCPKSTQNRWGYVQLWKGIAGANLNRSYKAILECFNVELDATLKSKIFFCNCHLTAPFWHRLIIFTKYFLFVEFFISILLSLDLVYRSLNGKEYLSSSLKRLRSAL